MSRNLNEKDKILLVRVKARCDQIAKAVKSIYEDHDNQEDIEFVLGGMQEMLKLVPSLFKKYLQEELKWNKKVEEKNLLAEGALAKDAKGVPFSQRFNKSYAHSADALSAALEILSDGFAIIPRGLSKKGGGDNKALLSQIKEGLQQLGEMLDDRGVVLYVDMRAEDEGRPPYLPRLAEGEDLRKNTALHNPELTQEKLKKAAGKIQEFLNEKGGALIPSPDGYFRDLGSGGGKGGGGDRER